MRAGSGRPVLSLVGIPFGVCWSLGNQTLSMDIFPAEKFGQLSAGINIFNCGILIAGNIAIGIFMDLIQGNYRIVFLWSAMGGLAIIPLLMVYRDWKRYGGPQNYVAPPVGMDTAG